jgi:hypothetical protein
LTTIRHGVAVLTLAAAAASCSGCILPKDLDLTAAGTAARSLQSAPYGTAGGDVVGDFRIGTKTFEVGADVGVAKRVDRDSQWLSNFQLRAGFAYVPRPFEGRVGWDVTGGVGVADRPTAVIPTTAWGPLIDGRASLLFRLTPDDTVWAEDEKDEAGHASVPVYLVVGAQLGGFFPSDHDERPPFPEVAGLLGLRFNDYSCGAP